jgi:hypothetical protein
MNTNQLTMQGYVPLTHPYTLPLEEAMYSRCLHTLNNGGHNIDYRIVALSENELEIWAKPIYDVTEDAP